MDERTLTALRGSIEKWEAIVAGTGVDWGSINCPLCTEFCHGPNYCAGCPVASKTGEKYCDGSPYIRFESVWPKSVPIPDGRPIITELAQAEIDFLRSLLPEAETT